MSAQAPASAGAPAGQRLFRALLPPLFAFLCAEGLLWAAARAEGQPVFAAASRVRWDAGLYVGQARDGADLVPCTDFRIYRRGTWCGNAGWLPAYPLLIRATAQSGLSYEAAGLWVALACALATLVLVWNTALREAGPRVAVPALALLALFPGALYAHVVFPISLVQLGAAGAIELHARKRPLLAGLCAAACAAAHPSGVVIAATIAASAGLLALREAPGARLRRLLLAALSGAISACGFLAACAALRVQTGRWDAYFLIQRKYGHGLNDPLASLWRQLGPLFSPGHFAPEKVGTAAQSVLVIALLAGALFAVLRGGGLRERLAALACSLSWLVPVCIGGDLSLYRYEGTLAPLCAAAPRLQRALLWAAAVLAAPLFFWMARFFFRGQLV